MFIDERGIYEIEPRYHDEVERITYVDFSLPIDEQQGQLKRLVDHLIQRGKDKRSEEISKLINPQDTGWR